MSPALEEAAAACHAARAAWNQARSEEAEAELRLQAARAAADEASKAVSEARRALLLIVEPFDELVYG